VSIGTTALRGGGSYVLNGRKIYITNAAEAGVYAHGEAHLGDR
jgi:alkylation response protein AidB-like acyl-CoA dehydrogenase